MRPHILTLYVKTKKIGKYQNNFSLANLSIKKCLILLENGTVLQNGNLIADTFNNCFCDIIKNLSIPKDSYFKEQTSNLYVNRVKGSIEKYKDHPSTVCLIDKILNTNNPKFSFNFVSFAQILDVINKLNLKKTSQTTNIPVPIIKRNKDVLALFIYLNFNNSL